MSPDFLREEFKALSLKYTGHSINISAYRQLSLTLGEVACLCNSALAKAYDNMAAHSSGTARTAYAQAYAGASISSLHCSALVAAEWHKRLNLESIFSSVSSSDDCKGQLLQVLLAFRESTLSAYD